MVLLPVADLYSIPGYASFSPLFNGNGIATDCFRHGLHLLSSFSPLFNGNGIATLLLQPK